MEEWSTLIVVLFVLGAWYAGSVAERVSLHRCTADVACECIRSFPAAVRETIKALNIAPKPPAANGPAPAAGGRATQNE